MNTNSPASLAAKSNGRIKTLLVDDSPIMLKLVAQILEHTGKFDVIGSASNGQQALRYASMLSPELILMDVHMPRLDGIQAARRIKQGKHPPVIVMVTSADDPVTRAAAERAGADGFVCKDFNLHKTIVEALQKLFPPAPARCAARDDSNKDCDECQHCHETEDESPSRIESCSHVSRRAAGSFEANPSASPAGLRGPRRPRTHEPAPLAQRGETTESSAAE